MATRKKAKAKRTQAPARKPAARTKSAPVRKKPATRRKSAPVRKKPATRRKAAPVRKKPAKKAPVRRAAPRKPRPAASPAPALKPGPAPAQPAPPGQRIGVVTHYYSHLAVAVIRLSGTLRVGDTIHIRGHTTDFSQRVESLEVAHAPVMEVGPQDDFGLKVIEHVREHDVVYKV